MNTKIFRDLLDRHTRLTTTRNTDNIFTDLSGIAIVVTFIIIGSFGAVRSLVFGVSVDHDVFVARSWFRNHRFVRSDVKSVSFVAYSVSINRFNDSHWLSMLNVTTSGCSPIDFQAAIASRASDGSALCRTHLSREQQ